MVSVAPFTGAWIETTQETTIHDFLVAAAHPPWIFFFFFFFFRRALRGAWIEKLGYIRLSDRITESVAPFTGAWIENPIQGSRGGGGGGGGAPPPPPRQSPKPKAQPRLFVAPFTGAWIETFATSR